MKLLIALCIFVLSVCGCSHNQFVGKYVFVPKTPMMFALEVTIQLQPDGHFIQEVKMDDGYKSETTRFEGTFERNGDLLVLSIQSSNPAGATPEKSRREFRISENNTLLTDVDNPQMQFEKRN